ncbi:energy transducer TonB [Pseudopelagicola sp. nBUS_19]|uniref:energy transducer TonB n=1 Tax=Pseudopelagicola sp. nBUS_19 TaxID=3395316 RepID=UPI003EBFD01C
MHIGHYISGAAHASLIGWAVFGATFRSDPPPLEVSEVTVVTTKEFEAVLRSTQAPSLTTDVAVPIIPAVDVQTPEMLSRMDNPMTAATASTTEISVPDSIPDLNGLTAPDPTEVIEKAPVMSVPDVDTAFAIPKVASRPVARPVQRVAPVPVAQPKPDTTINDTLQEAIKPDESGKIAEKIMEETAPEAAATEIITEPKSEKADNTAAPLSSLRPRARPMAGVNADGRADAAVAAALAEAGISDTTPTPSGPPLTTSEKDGLRVAVRDCWVVDVGSRAADVTVTIGFSLEKNGKVRGDIRLINAEGGDDTASGAAFQAARRAVLRCEKAGYDLPKDKYDHWRDVEITFNPDNMRLK